MAADRPGSYLSAIIGESTFANYQPDGNTVGLWHLDEADSPDLNDSYPGFGGWSTATTSTCGSYSMMGGVNVFGTGAYTQKTIKNLSAGTYTVKFNYYKLESWDGESARFFWNGVQQWSRVGTYASGTNWCGNAAWFEEDWATTVIVNHPGGDATLKFDSTLDQTPDDESWGVNNIRVIGPIIKDSSGNGKNGTPTGTTFTQGKIGKGRSFNGSSDYITANNPMTGNSSRTISAWVKISSVSADPAGIVGWGTGGTGQISYLTASIAGSYNFGFWGYSADLNSGVPSRDNTWHFLTFTYNGTTGTLYVDGVSRASANLSLNSQNSPLYIGKDNVTGFLTYPYGLIDEVRIDNIARTADEIRQAYEVGLRTHPITIDFGAKLDSGNLITGSGDLGFTVDATYYGLQNKGDKLFKGDKIIIRENYDGTEYIAQGTVTSVTPSTGAVTVVSWDSGSTFPSGGYTVNASVFKWQREYWNVTEPLDSQLNAVTNLTLRVTDGNEGRTIWLDDLKSAGDYLTTPAGSTITSSIGNRYFQYRTIKHSSDEAVSASLTSVTLDYIVNTAPATPTLDAPTNTAANQLLSPLLKTTATDADSDYIRYKIELCENVGMTTNCQTFTQPTGSPQTGWTGQNAETNTAYTSGTQATYTLQTPLAAATTYYWRSYAIDPGGINTWSGTQTPYSFTTTTAPTAPTIPYAEGSSNPTGIIDLTPEFSAIHNDADGDAANYYEIEVNTNIGFTGTVMWDTGAVSMSSLANGVRSTDVSYAGTTLTFNGTTYYWRIRFTDVKGATGAWSTTQNFTMNNIPALPSLDLPTNGATNQSLLPVLKTTTTDADSDYLRYKIILCTDSAMTLNCQTFTQPTGSPQTGWTGQNTEINTAYTSGTQGIYTIQSVLNTSTDYYWKSYAIDPGGSNTWSSTQTTPYSFTTTLAPAVASNCRIQESSNDTFLNVIWTDNATNEDKYEVQRLVDGSGWSVLQTNLPANTLSYQDSTISQNHTYQYRVAPYLTVGPTYANWCYTSTLNIGIGNFGINGLRMNGLKFN